MFKKAAGYTLVELMIAVAIVADIAILALPAYQRQRRAAQNSRFAADLRVASAAFEMYAAENSRYPAEAAVGQLPTGMAQYLRGVKWETTNSLGGRWDWDNNQGYAAAAVCVEFSTDADPLQMADIDARIDNGILSTGNFRERSPRRYAYIIE